MSNQSPIEWTDATWNPVRGCVKVSPGCKNCYAETFAERWRGIPGHPYEQGFNLRLVPEKLTEPLKWKKPRRIFVNSMSDLFQDGVPFEYVDLVFAAMAQAWHHTFQILTKRADRMQEYFSNRDSHLMMTRCFRTFAEYTSPVGPWPLPNVWLGVSAENQEWADRRIPFLLQTPAVVRFVSYEPALGTINFSRIETKDGAVFIDALKGTFCSVGSNGSIPYVGLDWIIVGGESGPGARPFNVKWARSAVEQCKAAGVPVFVKQIGARPYAVVQNPNCTAQDDDRTVIFKLKSRKGGDPEEWLEELKVREFPISQIGAKA